MGWLSAGGPVLALKIWMIMAIFGIWQMPHFWLLVLVHQSDYRAVGLPTPLADLGKAALERILLVWVVSVATMTLCLPLAELVRSTASLVVLTLNAVTLSIVACSLLLKDHRHLGYRALFVHLNLAVFISMVTVAIDRTIFYAG
jgi:protoheme IX farnesyltransferase